MLQIDQDKIPEGDSVCVIMQNPSCANSTLADKSVQFLEKLIFQKQYSVFKHARTIKIVNQFAYIQTKNFKGSNQFIGTHNFAHVTQAIESSTIILIAWGKTNPYVERQQWTLSLINKYPEKILLQTKSHPSRGTYLDFVLPYTSE